MVPMGLPEEEVARQKLNHQLGQGLGFVLLSKYFILNTNLTNQIGKKCFGHKYENLNIDKKLERIKQLFY
jgi:hypothetical protein